MTTALAIITKAMQKAGILTKNENPTADEASDALDSLNDMLASWSTEAMLIYARVWESFTVGGGVASYNIGTGQTFNTTRPMLIADSYVRFPTGSDSMVSIINDENFAMIQNKDALGVPNRLNYNTSFPTGIINLWPVPSTNYSLFILSEKQLTEFALNDTVLLPAGWKRALIYNLAVEINPEYGQPLPVEVAKIASESKGAIKTNIMRNRSMDWPTPSNQGNIYNGWWS